MFSKKLLEVCSPLNGRIEVIEDIGGKRRVVTETEDGQRLSQSGYLVERLWEKGLRECQNLNGGQNPAPSELKCQNVLILGLGAGSLIGVIKHYIPDVSIDAVEIDPVMVEIGRKFFGLKDEDANIYIEDAQRFVQKARKRAYDLICVDLFQGDVVPEFLETDGFLSRLVQLLSRDGLIIMNRLYYGKHREETKSFLDKLVKMYTIEQRIVAPSRFAGTNLLIVARLPDE